MDLCNHNVTKKRKLNQPNAHEDESKRKTSKSNGCFGRCCSRKRQDTPFETKEKPVKQVNNKVPLATENARQSMQTPAGAGAGDKESSIEVTLLSQSPLEHKWETNPNDLDNSNTKLFFENRVKHVSIVEKLASKFVQCRIHFFTLSMPRLNKKIQLQRRKPLMPDWMNRSILFEIQYTHL